MEVSKIIQDPIYYNKNPHNLFEKHSTYGLNPEGKKLYYYNPDNFRFHHQEKVREAIEKKIENFTKMKEMKKSKRLREKNLSLDENIKILYNKVKKYNSQIKNKFIRKTDFSTNFHERAKTLANEGRKRIYMPKNLNSFSNEKLIRSPKKQKNDNKTLLPEIIPRPIIVDYCLTYSSNFNGEQDTKYTNGYKNLGINSYFMGNKFNPFNYDPVRKNRTSRNVFGTLFCH